MKIFEQHPVLERTAKVFFVFAGAIVLAFLIKFSMKLLVPVLPDIITFEAAKTVFQAAGRAAGWRGEPPAPVRVSSLDRPTSLEGRWSIRLDDNSAYASAGYDDSSWETLRFPTIFMQYYYWKTGEARKKISGVIWIRKSIVIDNSIPKGDIGLILGRIGNADETFFNGVKIGGMGSFPPHEFSMWNHPRHYIIPKALIRHGVKNVIAVRIWYHTWGEMLGTLAIAGLDDWQISKSLSNFLLVIVDYIIIAMGVPIFLIFIIFFIRRRSSKEYIFYCFQLLAGLVLIMELCTYWNFYGDNLTRVKVLIVSWAAINVTHPMFLHRIYDFKRPRLELFFWLVVTTIVILAIFFTDEEQARPLGALGIIFLTSQGLYNFSCHCVALYKRSPYSKLFAFFGSIVVIGAIHDGMFYFLKLIGLNVNAGLLFKYMIFPYSAFVLYMGTTLVFVSRVVGMMDEIVDLNVNLEHKVKDRTSELHTAMEEMESMNDQLVKTRDALWGEMMLAKKIQTVLLPLKPLIGGYEITATTLPADNVGGDFYDVINSDGRDWLVIGDVAGHGVPAGIIMMMVQTSIHTALNQNPSLPPAKLLSVINRTITGNIRHLHEDTYVTITVFAVRADGRLHFAGLHQDIMVYRAKKRAVEVIETDGFLIGVRDDIDDMIGSGELALEAGDCLLVYTDGITESWRKGSVRDKRTTDDMYGAQRLVALFESLGERPTDEIREGILDSLDDFECNDDVTMVILKRLP
ncbi:MAG: serine/threonine-protein phosphatase [Spirochaetes bacterium]|nr:serine/threonine-protein phosphatase [Spirochaetota bacterium]